MKKQLTMGVAAALLFPFVAFAQTAQANYDAIVKAENTFAAQSAEKGTKAAFLANSAPTAFIAEEGKWANAQDVWAARPAQPNSRLTWFPVLADASQTGDLGYTTGPWASFQNGKPRAAGEYVTVWRKQPDGKLKFVVDMGIERVGIAPSRNALVQQPRMLVAPATPSAAPANIVLDLDTRFAAAEVLKPAATYQQYLSAEARIYRPGSSLMQGEAASANLKNIKGRYFFAPTGGYLAAAGDLGYVVGTFRHALDAKQPDENGTYLRIWRREAAAGWRLVLEVFNTIPSASAEAPQADGAVSGQFPVKRGE